MIKTKENYLINVNKKGIFNKIKMFLINLFSNSKQNKNEENELLNLQEQYRKGKIKEEDLSKEQIDKLCDLYDKQIEKLQSQINIKKQKMLEYLKKMTIA